VVSEDFSRWTMSTDQDESEFNFAEKSRAVERRDH
jgi:hypothetical protein